MADEPVTAWREPLDAAGVALAAQAPHGRDRRGRGHAGGGGGSFCGARGAVGGQRAAVGVAAGARRAANAELTRSKAAVQARYDLAVEAIKTFHTGVSEDFLLKEDQFKELRDRLLKSASDFYGKLGALLGKETDFASRRALAQSNFELAELTRKVGRPEAALAAHRAVLAAREALAAEPGADAGVKADVGRSLTAVAYLLNCDREDRRGAGGVPPVGVAAGGPGGFRPGGAGRAGGLPHADGPAPAYAGKPAEALAALKLARADQEALAAVPGASNDARRDLADTVNRTRRPAVADGQAGGGGGRVPHGAGDPAEAGRRRPRRHRVPQRAWRPATSTSATCWR